MPEDVPSGPEHDKGKSRAPIVRTEEEEEEASLAEDGDFAPGGDADYFAEEDEEGRFFGGGLTQEQKDILNIFDRVGGEGVQDDVSRRPWCAADLTARALIPSAFR